MKRATKKMSVLAAALLIAALVFSALFIVTQSEHDCQSADCSICACISGCLDVFTTERCKTAGSVFVSFSAFAAVLVLGAVICRQSDTSLVKLKIKLSD